MGKYVQLTGSSASNLYSVEEGPAIKSVIGKLCVKPSYPHNHEILDHIYNGLAIKAHQIYNYGRDHYTLGLPEGYGVYLDSTPLEDIQDAVESEVGFGVTISDSVLNTPQALTIAYSYAKDYWGWDSINNTFTAPPISPVSGYGLSIYEAEFDGEGVLRVNFYRGEEYAGPGATKPVYGIVRVRDHGFNLEELYYHVTYTPEGSSGVPDSYWFYQKGLGTYPALDGSVEVVYGSPFMPVIPLRLDNTSLGPECEDGDYVRDGNGNKIKPTTDLYKTSVKLCKRADTDFDELTREISSNPDIDEVDHSFLIFGIDVRSETKSGKQYLFQFFESIALETSGASEIEVKDSSYRIKVKFSDIVRTTHSGVLDDTTVIEYSGNDLTLSYQTGTNAYTRLVVSDLYHINYVEGSYNIETSLSLSADEDNYNFIIPLRYSLIQQDRSMLERENLMAESFKLVFNSYEAKKLKWYQRDWFKILINVVSIVITAFSFGTLGAGITAAKTAFEALLVAAEAALFAALITAGFRLLAQFIPPEVLALVAVVALAAAGLGSFTGTDFSSITAESLMQLSSNLVGATQTGLEYEMDDLTSDMKEFGEEIQELNDELDLLEEELAGNPLFNVQDILVHTPMFIENEAPTDFYTRTIHMGNIGVQSLNVIESYVDTQLKLPEKI